MTNTGTAHPKDSTDSSTSPGTQFSSPAFIVYFVFTISGAAALIYQIIWARWLSLIFGNTTPSVSIVLASFMLGLALGSWLAGRMLARVGNPMIVYAWLEIGIGLFALCFRIFSEFTDELYALLVTTETAFAITMGVKIVLAFSLLIVPTSLMGATLPILTDFFRRSPRHSRSWRVGLLYAANTFGAALGSVCASFILIELVGVRNTTLIAASLNIFIGLWAFWIARSTSLLPFRVSDTERRAITPTGKLAIAVLTASGALALASEVLWTRTLEILVGNSSYAFALILVVYLVGIAVGSWIMSLAVNRLGALPIWLASTQVAIAVWILAAIAAFDVVGESIFQYSFKSIPLTTTLMNYLTCGSVLFPLALFSGAAFPLATRILDPKSEEAEGSLIARAYAWNTAGAVVGALAAGFIIAPFFDFFHSLYLLMVLYGLTGLFAIVGALAFGVNFRPRLPAFAVGVLAVVLTGLSASRMGSKDYYADRLMDRFPGIELPYHEPGIQGVTTAARRVTGGVTTNFLLVNGVGMTRKATATKLMAHLPMLIHPDPEKTLIIGFGMGTTYRSAITHGRTVTSVELVEEVYGALDIFYEDAERIRAYPMGRWVVNDGRSFLKLTRDRFDVITIDPPPPIDSAGVNNLYSKEFLELARDRLAKGGIMAHWIPLPGSGSGVRDQATVFMLIRTFAEVFPETLVWKGSAKGGIHLLGSVEQIAVSLKSLRKRLADPAIRQDLNELDSVPFDFFLSGFRPNPQQWASLSTVTDDRPSLEFAMLRFWREGIEKVYPMIIW